MKITRCEPATIWRKMEETRLPASARPLRALMRRNKVPSGQEGRSHITGWCRGEKGRLAKTKVAVGKQCEEQRTRGEYLKFLQLFTLAPSTLPILPHTFYRDGPFTCPCGRCRSIEESGVFGGSVRCQSHSETVPKEPSPRTLIGARRIYSDKEV